MKNIKKWTSKQIAGHIKKNVSDYGAAVVVAAMYKKLYGQFPIIGLSGAQAEFAQSIITRLPDKVDAGEVYKPGAKTVEQAIQDKILFIGNKMPSIFLTDKRSKFMVLGSPQEMIDECKA